ncbi:folate receptor 2 (fetal) (predicted), isoform CRA_b [Rattus norvegicus]|uniref:Folate receptor 2 (Fetal) (Predicted), isoform CRA_b n=1 Tax=Rattus norvegicus TaxID=10116 RepID=A6I6X0_RAT|nr:folate receptor 2 (fetal) (predicted), isoform CRA_b [Rattus norvegicus]
MKDLCVPGPFQGGKQGPELFNYKS